MQRFLPGIDPSCYDPASITTSLQLSIQSSPILDDKACSHSSPLLIGRPALIPGSMVDVALHIIYPLSFWFLLEVTILGLIYILALIKKMLQNVSFNLDAAVT